jgi:hypothetical protein
MRAAEKMGRLFDYAVEHSDGFTYQDVEKDLGWSRAYFIKVARQLRLLLGHDDEINLVCDVQGRREPWLYKLVGNFEQSRDWSRIRTDDAESRLTTIGGVLSSVIRSSDGRSRDGPPCPDHAARHRPRQRGSCRDRQRRPVVLNVLYPPNKETGQLECPGSA